MANEGELYFRYQNEEVKLPVFVRFSIESFDEKLISFLKKIGFSKVESNESVIKEIDAEDNARVLEIKEAGSRSARQIRGALESDRFGEESIVPKEGYRVYRYKNVALMVFSFAVKEWTLGCYKNFGSDTNEKAFHAVINRFLSLALAPLGVIGFWGVPVEEGIVVMKQKSSQGEAIYFDVYGHRVFSIDGVTNLTGTFKILKLENRKIKKDILMSSSDLLGYLSVCCAYFDYNGLSVPVRQLIHNVSRDYEGVIHPEEFFKPRTDLSLG